MHPTCVQLYNGEVVACKEIDLEESEEMQEVRQLLLLLNAVQAAASTASTAAHACCSGCLLSLHVLLLRCTAHHYEAPSSQGMRLGQAHVVCCRTSCRASCILAAHRRPVYMQAFVTEATRLHALRHPNVIGEQGVLVGWR